MPTNKTRKKSIAKKPFQVMPQSEVVKFTRNRINDLRARGNHRAHLLFFQVEEEQFQVRIRYQRKHPGPTILVFREIGAGYCGDIGSADLKTKEFSIPKHWDQEFWQPYMDMLLCEAGQNLTDDTKYLPLN